ncbi:MAG: hypothetical protein B6244_09935 [Candidatus Cloacimonetes bacterium 4572_55]|nr:MAG: hypothetical protein B6244_09935 [Candidatus Cloacimonetes bacterium 4572_55]
MTTAILGDDPSEILRRLGIGQPAALIMSIGGAAGLEDRLGNRLIQLYGRAIARASGNIDALIVDGGTKSGVMQMMGQGVADRGRKSILLGVTPRAKVLLPDEPDRDHPELTRLDSNHSHFVLVDCEEWGEETDTMCALLKTMANRAIVTAPPTPLKEEPKKESKKRLSNILGGAKKKSSHNNHRMVGEIPVVTVLVNGGEISKREALYSVRQGWPIIILEGSGRLADEIVRLWREKPELIEDPIMAEIVEEGHIYPYPIDGPVEGMERLVVRLLREDGILLMAWEQFSIYDLNANIQKDKFHLMQRLILILGVMVTALAVLKKTFNGGLLRDSLSWFLFQINRIPAIDIDIDQWSLLSYNFIDSLYPLNNLFNQVMIYDLSIAIYSDFHILKVLS